MAFICWQHLFKMAQHLFISEMTTRASNNAHGEYSADKWACEKGFEAHYQDHLLLKFNFKNLFSHFMVFSRNCGWIGFWEVDICSGYSLHFFFHCRESGIWYMFFFSATTPDVGGACSQAKIKETKPNWKKLKLFSPDFSSVSVVIAKQEEDERLSVAAAAAHSDSLYAISVCEYLDLTFYNANNLPGSLILLLNLT